MKHMLELRAFDTVGTWTAKSQGEVCCFSSQKIPLTWRRASWNFLQDRTWWGVRLVYNFQGQHRRGHSSLSSQSFVLPMHSPGSDSARWAPKASHHRLPGWQSLYHIPRVGSLWLSESCALAQGSYYPTLFSSPIFHRSQTCIVSWEFFLLLLTLPFEFHSFTLFFKYLFICLFLYLAVLGSLEKHSILIFCDVRIPRFQICSRTWSGHYHGKKKDSLWHMSDYGIDQN